MEDVIFALDIGTRSVTGVLVEKEAQEIRLLDHCMVEHSERSMRDGQIHDVPAVAATIQTVKRKLEEKYGSPLRKVCVAAAGRSLKTIEASASVDLREFPIKTDEDVKHLELSALKNAQEKLAGEQKGDSYNNYYCVGFSLLYYKLDDERIGSLIGQKGNEASVDIIATFLPKVVVESLFSAVKTAGLEVEAMTLEPIAALHLLVPESMRRLNVVLVDIGAGTSDIAITDQGTVISYGMVPVAGDEITEAISDRYLLDFPEAERVKREIVSEKTAETEDILGFTTEITYDELVSDLDKEIQHLSEVIADEIKRLNEKSPRAVMLVGGGSLTPKITERLAYDLDLPTNRVAIRGVEAVRQLVADEDFSGGPAFVTPVGIAITAKERPVQYITVHVNEEQVHLFEMDKLTIGDCLVQAGLEPKRFYGKPGLAKIVTVNGKEITIPGEFGEAPRVYLNGEPATVHQPVEEGDAIRIERGKDGGTAAMTLNELIGEGESLHVTCNHIAYPLGTIITVNGERKTGDYIIQDKDEIEWKKLERLKDFLDVYFPERTYDDAFPVIINGQEVQLSTGKTTFLVNGEETDLYAYLGDGDIIEVIPATLPKVEDVFRELDKPYWRTIRVLFNGESVTLKKTAHTISRRDEQLEADAVLQKHDRLTITDKEQDPFVFQDVFRFVEIDLTNATGHFKLWKNNEEAAFDTVIEDGDELAIIWDK